MSDDPKHDPRLEAKALRRADGLDVIDLVPDAMIERWARAGADPQRREAGEEFSNRMLAEYIEFLYEESGGRLSSDLIANAAIRACLATAWRTTAILRSKLAILRSKLAGGSP